MQNFFKGEKMLFSVIIPTHNSENYISKCLDSILIQKVKDFEIILIDDGNTDSTNKIILNYKKKYSNIRLYTNRIKGVSAARNLGITKSYGKYIIFVDSDDKIAPDLFNQLVPHCNANTDLIKYNAIYVGGSFSPDDDRFICKPFIKKNGSNALIDFCNQEKIFATPWMYCAKKEIYTNNHLFFPVGRVHEDVAIIPLLIAFSKTVTSINYIGYYYIQHSKSIMNDRSYEKKLSRAYDFLFHYDYLHKRIGNALGITLECKKIFFNYLSKRINCKIEHLLGKDRQKFITELSARNVDQWILDGQKIANKYH